MEGKSQESTTIAFSSNQTMPPQDQALNYYFKTLNPYSDNLIKLVKDLNQFYTDAKGFKDISNYLTSENMDILRNLNYRDNIRINVILTKIYSFILSHDTLYSSYLVEYSDEKLNIVLQLIDECTTLIQKLMGFILDEGIYKLREQTLSFIKCIYFNYKGKISNLSIIQKLEELIESFNSQFYSEAFDELNQNKELFEILKTQDLEKIKNFEEKFSQINNYYEQYEVFKKFVKLNSSEDINDIEQDKIDFYEQYGLLLLKFCKYHQYIFLNKDEKNNEKIHELNSADPNRSRVVFLLDKIKASDEGENKNEEIKINEDKDKEKEKDNDNNVIDKNKGNRLIVDSISQKSFISFAQSEEYNDLIRKQLNKYIEITKNHKENPKLKNVLEQMTYFLSILNAESYVPLYLSDFNKITITDNFTPSFSINVPAGRTNEFYLETKANETMLVFIEFSLDEKSKDISFQINKYESYTDEFKNIFIEEKVGNSFKIFLLCNGYSLYQIVFDNYYSWFTSKDVNYRVTLLELNDRPIKMDEDDDDEEDNKEENKENNKENKKEEKEENNINNEKEEQEEKKEEKEEEIHDIKEEKKEEINNEEDKFYCNFNGKNMSFNHKEISQRINLAKEKKDENIIYIPVLLYLNTLRIISFQTDENGKEKLSFKEFKDDEEDIITKSFFEYRIKNYLTKTLKLKSSECKDKKIFISIYSLNRDLSSLNGDIFEKINAVKTSTINNSVNDAEFTNYLEKIGFYPGEEIEGFKTECKLYDLCEQDLIYHLFLNKTKNEENKNSILFMLFDEKVCNAGVLNKGTIFTKLKEKKNYLSNININDENGVLDFLENVNDTFEGIELVIGWVDSKGEYKKKTEDLVEKIKKYCEEKIKINVHIYDEEDITCEVIKYINLFYQN